MTSRRFADATHVLAVHIDDYLNEWGDQLGPDRHDALTLTVTDLHDLEQRMTAAFEADNPRLELS